MTEATQAPEQHSANTTTSDRPPADHAVLSYNGTELPCN